MRMSDIERLDLKVLKNLVALKEKNHELLKLESQRERLRGQIEDVDEQIRTYLKGRPSASPLLDTIRSAAAGAAKGRRVSRPRNWLKEKVTVVLKATRKPQTPAQIRNTIAENYPEQATKNLYISIFQMLKRNEEFKKTKDGGWSLKKSKKSA